MTYKLFIYHTPQHIGWLPNESLQEGGQGVGVWVWRELYSTTTGAKCSGAQYTRHSLSTRHSQASGSSNVASQQFGLSKDTFRWTFQRAKINFNRLKILIFPANNQRNFPSQRTSQSKSVGRSKSHAGGDLMRFTVHYTAFCQPLYI